MSNPSTVTIASLAEAGRVEEEPERLAHTWADSCYDQHTPPEWLVEGLITKASVNLLVAPGGSGKTYAASYFCVRCAIGKDVLGFPTKQTTVLFLDEESGKYRLPYRLFAALNGSLVKREDKAPIAYVSMAGTDMGNPDHVNEVHVKILEINAGLVIVDALADVMPGRDENSVKDVMPIMQNFRRIADATGAAFIILHHSNKATGNYRGSTAIQGAADLMLQMEKSHDGKYFSFSVEKARDIEPIKFTAEATWVKDPPQFYLTATDFQKPPKDIKNGWRFIIRYVSENPNATPNSISAACASEDIYSEATAVKEIRKVRDAGYIETAKVFTEGGRGKAAEYIATDQGRKVLEGE